MDDIKTLMVKWADANYINPDGLEAAHSVMIILVTKIELLEQQVAALQSQLEGK